MLIKELERAEPESKEDDMTPTKIVLWIAPLTAMVLMPGSVRAQTCASDTECGQGMVCHSDSVTTCSGGTAVPVQCEPNTVCPTAPPATDPICTNTTIARCVYTWDLPCNVDLDCGDGFACQPATMGTCSSSGPAASGGGSSSGAGGGSGTGSASTPLAPPTTADAGTMPDPVCVTTTSFPGSCLPKVATCAVDSDCPSVFKCMDFNVPTTISSGAIAIDGGANIAPTPPSTTSAPTAPASKTCQPPTSNPGRTDGVGTSGPTASLGSTADGGATTKGTTTPPVAAVPGGDSSSGTQGPATKTSGGCALVGRAPGGSAIVNGLFLGLLGALALLRRRRS